MKKLSLVIPVYNETDILTLYNKLIEILENDKFDYEIIFVDDGSRRDLYLELLKVKSLNKKIKIIRLSKNYGSHTAVLAGISNMSGDCVTIVSADLQEPPEIIEKMFDKWIEGNKVVLAVREDREEAFSQKFFSNTYYKLMRKFALKNMPKGGFDCFLIDKEVAKILSEMKEKNSTLMGQILWCGFKTDKIYYVRKKREVGESKWTLSKKVKLVIDSFLAFSYFPIKFILMLGFLFSISGFIGIIYILINILLKNILQDKILLITFILFISGIQMLTIGIIGEYVWRILEETRKRPIYIIEEKIGFDEGV